MATITDTVRAILAHFSASGAAAAIKAMQPPRTIAQARALPEIQDADFVWKERVMTQREALAVNCKLGDRTWERCPRLFSPQQVPGAAIAIFVDTDGRRMKVLHTAEEGWCKVQLRP